MVYWHAGGHPGRLTPEFSSGKLIIEHELEIFEVYSLQI